MQPGSLAVGGRYRLVRQLGTGGMGVVWEAVCLSTGQGRAIKFVRDDAEASTLSRFIREAEALRGIVHPNVVRTYEVASDGGTPAIVMELLHGESLGARLEREQVLSLGQTAAILGRVAAAVSGAHAAGIIHRDLKPDNIFLCVDGNGTDVRVLDFGVAKRLSSVQSVQDKLTETGTLVGTPLYMSPEQAAGARELDPRTDVWSLSIIAFECLAGMMPIRGENYGQVLSALIRGAVKRLAQARPDLPPDFLAAVDAALVELAHRPGLGPIMGALRAHADPFIAPPPGAMRPVMAGDPTEVITASSLPRERAEPSARRWWAVTGVFVLGILGTLTVAHAVLRPLTRWSIRPAAPPSAWARPAPAPEPAPEPAPAPAPASADPPAPAPAVSAAPAPSTSASVASRPRPRAGMNPASAPSTDRLQGGVGGQVPF